MVPRPLHAGVATRSDERKKLERLCRYVSRPAVSQHLKVLLDAGLVAMRKDAQRNIYSLKREGFASMGDYIEGLWDTALQRYRDAARNEQGEMHE